MINFEGWKKLFDSYPIDRKGSGTRYYRPVDDINHIIVDLGFDNLADADAALAALCKLRKQVEGTVMTGPKARILSIVETWEY